MSRVLPRRAGKGLGRREHVDGLSAKQRTETSVYERDASPDGFEGAGPAVIEEYGSTTLAAGRAIALLKKIGTMGEIRINCGGK